ncbi:MAG: bifunctional 5,10-methylenetetrahydrofolate dehydrogenase/5,10-methenyltetrahydrofolate cyclohydrolase [Candidatus Latescibacteria bacterium]|jgi:methylenetetrahydrofolate dehydrogenase (NADP+) / methenyltetrahydrofolate cyclohydrolase|nr:bifunctional 5,10-methylenetetrahydrofolate dehydrogenase/5,10-methenyltetrahydrofolate cyclohydrolase [Candidatus Latescibacterota bacterium]
MDKQNIPVIMSGRNLADQLQETMKDETNALKRQGIVPGLGTVLVGDDPASATYIAMKHKACEDVGMASIHAQLPKDVSQSDLEATLRDINMNPEVDAYIVQLPLTPGLNEESALMAVDPEKDADGLHPVNLGRLVMGAPGPLPCTPAGIVELLIHYGVSIEGKHVVIVGRGLTIGRPLALLLSLKRPNCNAAVTVIHTGVEQMGYYTRQADILVAAAGSPGLISADMVKPGAAVVGAGLTRVGKKLHSDVEDSVSEVAGWVTPRIGGVGPMTVAMLLQNTITAAKKRLVK